MIKVLTLILAISGLSQASLAAPSIEPGIAFELPWNDLSVSQKEVNEVTREIASYMTRDLRSTGSFEEVAEKLLTGAVQNYSQSEKFLDTDLSRTTSAVTGLISPNLATISLTDTEEENALAIAETSEATPNPYQAVLPGKENKVKHELEIALDAPGSKAKLSYQGYLDINAEINVNGDVDLSLHKALDKTTSIRVVHHTNMAESVLSLDLRW